MFGDLPDVTSGYTGFIKIKLIIIPVINYSFPERQSDKSKRQHDHSDEDYVAMQKIGKEEHSP